jgi:hypothetical protein
MAVSWAISIHSGTKRRLEKLRPAWITRRSISAADASQRFLFQKAQKDACTDLASVVGYQKTGAGDLVIPEQEDVGSGADDFRGFLRRGCDVSRFLLNLSRGNARRFAEPGALLPQGRGEQRP